MKKQQTVVEKKKLVLDKERVRILDIAKLPDVVVGGWNTGIGCCSGHIIC